MRINECSFPLQFISYIICQASIRILKAKLLLSALHVHDSCFKMLAKKLFLSTKLIKLKPRFRRFQTTKVNPSVYNCSFLNFHRSTLNRSSFLHQKSLRNLLVMHLPTLEYSDSGQHLPTTHDKKSQPRSRVLPALG